MEINKKNLSLPVELTTIQAENIGFILMSPATFKIGDITYKLAIQGSGLALVRVDNPSKLVNIDLANVLVNAAEDLNG